MTRKRHFRILPTDLATFITFLFHTFDLVFPDFRVPMKTSSTIPIERIERAIYLIRGQKVMLDSDLAALYGVTKARLDQRVNRNIERSPQDFMFQLTNEGSKV